MSRARFAKVEQATGMNHNPRGFVADERLRGVVDPIATLTLDWVHSALQTGTLTVEMTEMMRCLAPLGIRHADVKAFLSDSGWCFPGAYQRKGRELWRVFDSHRASSEDASKARFTHCSLSRSEACWATCVPLRIS